MPSAEATTSRQASHNEVSEVALPSQRAKAQARYGVTIAAALTAESCTYEFADGPCPSDIKAGGKITLKADPDTAEKRQGD